jgi:hypothetical protein
VNLGVAIVLAAVILGGALLGFKGFSVHQRTVNELGHSTVDLITTLLGEMQLDLHRLVEDVESIHRRLEYLEERDRGRP